MIDPFYTRIVEGIEQVNTNHRRSVTVESSRRSEWARVGYDANENIVVVEIHKLEVEPTTVGLELEGDEEEDEN